MNPTLTKFNFYYYIGGTVQNEDNETEEGGVAADNNSPQGVYFLGDATSDNFFNNTNGGGYQTSLPVLTNQHVAAIAHFDHNGNFLKGTYKSGTAYRGTSYNIGYGHQENGIAVSPVTGDVYILINSQYSDEIPSGYTSGYQLTNQSDTGGPDTNNLIVDFSGDLTALHNITWDGGSGLEEGAGSGNMVIDPSSGVVYTASNTSSTNSASIPFPLTSDAYLYSGGCKDVGWDTTIIGFLPNLSTLNYATCLGDTWSGSPPTDGSNQPGAYQYLLDMIFPGG